MIFRDYYKKQTGVLYEQLMFGRTAYWHGSHNPNFERPGIFKDSTSNRFGLVYFAPYFGYALLYAYQYNLKFDPRDRFNNKWFNKRLKEKADIDFPGKYKRDDFIEYTTFNLLNYTSDIPIDLNLDKIKVKENIFKLEEAGGFIYQANFGGKKLNIFDINNPQDKEKLFNFLVKEYTRKQGYVDKEDLSKKLEMLKKLDWLKLFRASDHMMYSNDDEPDEDEIQMLGLDRQGLYEAIKELGDYVGVSHYEKYGNYDGLPTIGIFIEYIDQIKIITYKTRIENRKNGRNIITERI